MASFSEPGENRRTTQPPFTYNRQKAKPLKKANLCYNLIEMSQHSLIGSNASEMEKQSEKVFFFLSFSTSIVKGQTIASLLNIGDNGVFVSNGLGFSAYKSCSLSSTVLVIPLI